MRYMRTSTRKEPIRNVQVHHFAYQAYVTVDRRHAETRMVIPSQCGKSFLRYSSWLPHTMQLGNAGSAACKCKRCSHATHCQSQSWLIGVDDGKSQQGQAKVSFKTPLQATSGAKPPGIAGAHPGA